MYIVYVTHLLHSIQCFCYCNFCHNVSESVYEFIVHTIIRMYTWKYFFTRLCWTCFIVCLWLWEWCWNFFHEISFQESRCGVIIVLLYFMIFLYVLYMLLALRYDVEWQVFLRGLMNKFCSQMMILITLKKISRIVRLQWSKWWNYMSYFKYNLSEFPIL